MSSRYEDKPYKVVRQRGTSVMLRSNNGHIIYRNVSHVMVKDKVINLSLILSLSHRQTQLMSLNPINLFDFTVNWESLPSNRTAVGRVKSRSQSH
jgi:hypothetical protein